jgi:hypothetical protein
VQGQPLISLNFILFHRQLLNFILDTSITLQSIKNRQVTIKITIRRADQLRAKQALEPQPKAVGKNPF